MYSESGPAKIFIAANRLPFSAYKEDETWKFKESPGGLVSALKGTDVPMTWIGWPGSFVEKENQATVDEKIRKKSNCFQLRPVFLSSDEQREYYDGFSNQMIWPNFHDLTNIMEHTPNDWSSYKSVNQLFAKSIYTTLKDSLIPGQINNISVWIHDYQLLLTPKYLRQILNQSPHPILQNTKIGFFLHIPFPSPHIFGHFSKEVRDQIIESLLASDLFGAHKQEYVDNFIENTKLFSKGKLVDVNQENNIVRTGTHSTHIGVYPIGIDHEYFDFHSDRESRHLRIKNIVTKYSDVRILLGVDRLDPAKGLIEKFLGYANFLEKHPEYRGTTSLIQVAVPSRTNIKSYQQLKSQLFDLAELINIKYSVVGRPLPIEVLYDSFSIEDLSVLYQKADALLVTSLKDGMNLVSFEYTACQAYQADTFGSLVLSKNTGAANYLHGSLLIDPKRPADICQNLHRALTMSKKEKESRLLANFQYVRSKTSKSWAYEFLSDLNSLADQFVTTGVEKIAI